MFDEREPKPQRSILSGLGVVVLLSFLLVGGVTTFLYQQCTTSFWDSRWLYPDAEIVAGTAYFLSTQTRTLRIAATPAIVEEWIRVQVAQITRAAVVSGNVDAVAEPSRYTLEADPQGNGTLLIYSRNCP